VITPNFTPLSASAHLAAFAQSTALTAIEQRRTAECLGLPGFVVRAPGAEIRAQEPINSVFRQAMAEHCTAVIEDDCINFARCRPQHAADHLAEQAHLLRGSRQDAAADLGHIPAFGQYHAIADNVDLAGCEARQGRVAFVLGRSAVDVLGPHSRFIEPIAQVDRVADTGREAYGFAPLAKLVSRADDVGDELLLVHSLG
jgi:hypothetical protein